MNVYRFIKERILESLIKTNFQKIKKNLIKTLKAF